MINITEPKRSELHKCAISAINNYLDNASLNQTPAEYSWGAVMQVHQITGVKDPFREKKRENNFDALKFVPELKNLINTAVEPFYCAVKLAIAGNIIDLGIQDRFDIKESIERVISKPLAVDRTELLKKEFESGTEGSKLLYIADNAGEIVFDKIFLEYLTDKYPFWQITLAVKGGAIMNDVMLEDVEQVGMPKAVKVIDNGNGCFGTVLDLCSEAFKKEYFASSLIISKGQANYETLEGRNENIYFLLQTKCQCIAQYVGTKVYDAVVLHAVLDNKTYRMLRYISEK